MTELLQAWVLRETGIRLEDLSQDFSTGYKLGQVLCKLNLQPDFDMFQQQPTPEAMVNNFTRLQPTIKSLGIKFDTRRANALVREDKGAASQLLNEIRMVQAVEERQNHVKSTSHPPLGKTLGVKGTLNRTLLQVQQHRSKQGVLEQFQGEHFEDLMRQHAANPKAMAMELHVQQFADEGSAQAAAAVAGEQAAQEMRERARRAFHDDCRDRSAAARKKAADLDNRVAQIHTTTQQRHRELKEKDARGIRAAEQTVAAKQQAALDAQKNDMRRGIQAFEDRFDKVEKGSRGKAAAVDSATDAESGQGTTPLNQAQRLKQFLPDKERMQREAEEYMQRLHDRRKSSVKAAKERRVRRHKLLQEEAAATEAVQKAEEVASALAALQRMSEEEQRIDERLRQLRAEEDVLVANRDQRLAQYTERRMQDHADALKREEGLYQALKGQVSEEVERERRQWRRAREQRAQAKAEQHHDIAERVTHELVGLALLHADYSSRTGVPIPGKLDEQADKEVDETIDGATLHDYMLLEGDWATECNNTSAAEATGDTQDNEAPEKEAGPKVLFNADLGAAINDIRVVAEPPPPDAAPSLDLPVRMAIVGGPFTGKTTLAQSLAESQHATVIVPENLVQAALLAAAQYIDPQPEVVEEEVECDGSEEEVESAIDSGKIAAVPGTDDSSTLPVLPGADTAITEGDADGNAHADGEEVTKKRTKIIYRTIDPPPPPKQVAIGRRAQEALIDGEQVSEADTACLVAESIMQLQSDYCAWKKANPDAISNADSAPACSQGFILDGYPRNVIQAMALEKELTGLNLPAEIEYTAGNSKIAPPGPDSFRAPTRPLKSCLDSVVFLELDDAEVAVSRAVGRRMDPTTGVIYHMDLSPPPGDVPGLLERLQPVKSISNDTEQLQKRLQVHVEATPALRDWLRRFDRLLWTINADAPPADVVTQALGIAGTARDSKDAAARCVAAAAAAKEAKRTAETAAEYAKQAQQATLATVQELLVAKRAEVEAEQLIRQQAAPPDPKSKDAKGKKVVADPAAEEAAQKTANAAAALLAEQAAQQCAEHVTAGETANRQAHERAEEASVAAQAAADAALQAKRSIHDANKSCEAEIRAKEAAAAAESAAEGAAAAAAVATAAAERAAKTVANAQAKLNGPIEELTDSAALLEAEAEEEEEAAAGGEEAEVEPQAPVVQVAELDDPTAQRLLELWKTVEKSYFRGAKIVFSGLRRLRESCEKRMYDSQKTFATYLTRPDGRQLEVTKFQTEFNAIDLDMLKVPEVQAELALRTEELRDKLWGMCDTKLEENTTVKSKLVSPEIHKHTVSALSQGYSALVQVEMDSFVQTVGIIRQLTCHRYSLPTPLYPILSLVEVMGDSDGDLAPLLDAKTGIELPEWVSVEDMPILTTALKRAAAALARDQRNTFKEACAPPPAAGKKGAKPPVDSRPPVDLDPEIAEASDVFCATMLECERSILRSRLQAIAARAVVDTSHSDSLMTATADRLQKSMKGRFIDECEAVASAIVVFMQAVVKAENLPNDLKLSDNGVIIDLSTFVVPQPAPQQLRPPSPEPLAPGLLSLKQISCLVSVAQQVTTCEFITTRDCTNLLQQLSAEGVGRFGTAFPVEWREATWHQMYSAIVNMDAHASCYIDWLELVAGLLIQARPELIRVTPKALAAAAVALDQADSDKDRAVTLEEWMACPMWFQPKRVVNDNATYAGDDGIDTAAPPATGVFKPSISDAEHIKNILWELFSTGDKEDPDDITTPEPSVNNKVDTTDQVTPETGAPDQTKSGSPGQNSKQVTPQSGTQSREKSAVDGNEPKAVLASDSISSIVAANTAGMQPGDTRKMSYTRMLLYLCADRELPLAMRKAFSVVAKDSSPRVALQAPDICRILYPNGLTGKQIFKVPVGEAEVAEIIARMRGLHVEKEPDDLYPPPNKGGFKGKAAGKGKVGAQAKGKDGKKGGKEEESKEAAKPEVEAVAQVTSDQFSYHSRGAALLTTCGSRYKLRDMVLDFRRVPPCDDVDDE